MIAKIKCIVFIVMICNCLHLIGQTTILKYGKIVFVKETKIYDTIAFKTSKEKFKIDFIDALRKQIIKEKQLLNKEIDSYQIESSLKLIKKGMNNFFFDEIYTTKDMKYIIDFKIL